MYLLFAGSNYYPIGGWSAYKGSYSTLSLAEEAAANILIPEVGIAILSKPDWWQIVSLDGLVLVKQGGSLPPETME